MGCTQSCTHPHPHRRPLCTSLFNSFNTNQLKMLQLLYQDLALRSSTGKLTKENFLISQGLWGQRIFRKFDSGNGTLEYEDFLQVVGMPFRHEEHIAKGGFRKKVRALFSFYQKDGSITFQQLFRMLYSYPTEGIKKLVENLQFLDFVVGSQRSELINKNSKSHELSKSFVQHSTDCPEDQQKHSGEKLKMKTQVVLIGDAKQKNPERKLKKINHANKNEFTLMKEKLLKDIPMLVSKFAEFLFRELNYKPTQVIPEIDFIQLATRHSNFFSVYFEGFYNYIWEIEETDNNPIKSQPQFITRKNQINSAAFYINQNEKEQRFLRLYKNTLFVFKKQSQNIPIDIHILQGLFIQKTEFQQFTGFVVKHKDGHYLQQSYMFKDQNLCGQWMNILNPFLKTSITELYYTQQKIYAGNTCEVYRSVERATGNKVSIKFTDKFRQQPEVIEKAKNQIRILQMCSHPNIIKFIRVIQTAVNLSLVTEYMDMTLEEYVKGKQFLEEYEVSIIMKQLFSAIIYMNYQGLMHRNISPSNIMVNKSQNKYCVQQIKLISFDEAVFFDSKKQNQTSNQLTASAACTAPEILQNQLYNETADNFSLGVVMYFMLCGSYPFESPSLEIQKQLITKCNPDLQKGRWMHITDNAKDLLTSLLCKRSKRRLLVDAIEHPWIIRFTQLKDIIGRNRQKQPYFL